jgi:UDP-glucose:glycoprotein glucosyltransferase
VHHAVFVLDFSKKDDLSRLVEDISTFIKRQLPIRFGVVALSTDETGEAIAKIFYHLVDAYGRAVAMKFVEDLLESFDPTTLSSKTKSLYSAIHAKSPIYPGHEKLSYDDLIAQPDVATQKWVSRLGVPADGVIFANGQLVGKDDNWINKAAAFFRDDILIVQKAVYAADITEDDDILEFFLQHTPKRRNQYIFPAEASDVRFMDLVDVNEGVYVRADGAQNTVIWIVDDFDSAHGSELVKAAAAFQEGYPVTVGLVHNPSITTGEPNLSLLIYHLAKSGMLDDGAGAEKFRQLLQEVDLVSQENSGDIERVLGVKASSWRSVDSEEARKFWSKAREFAGTAGFQAGERGIIINGRVHLSTTRLMKIVGPIQEGDVFGMEDFQALHNYELSERIEPAVKAALDMDLFSPANTYLTPCF